MKAKKLIPISGCLSCPHVKLDFPSEEAEKKAEALKEEDFDNLFKYFSAVGKFRRAYCMENDDPPFQFVLRPTDGDLDSVPDWCNLPNAPPGLETLPFFKQVILPEA